jgi:predicted dehydrogenase
MDPQPGQAKKTAEQFGIPKYYTDFDTFVQDGSLDAIDICSPPHVHADQAVKAAEMGKHILCEKPLATTMEDAQRIERAVEKAGILFMTGFTYRYHPLVRIAKNIVESPSLLQINYSFKPTVSSDHWTAKFNETGGFLVEQAVHWFDLFNWWCGRPESVYATTDSSSPYDAVFTTLTFKKGGIALIAFNSRGIHRSFHFFLDSEEFAADLQIELLPYTRGGTLHIYKQPNTHLQYLLGGWKVYTSKNNLIFPIAKAFTQHRDAHLVPFFYEINQFISDIQQNSNPENSVSTGREALEIALAAKTSILEGKKITL